MIKEQQTQTGFYQVGQGNDGPAYIIAAQKLATSLRIGDFGSETLPRPILYLARHAAEAALKETSYFAAHFGLWTKKFNLPLDIEFKSGHSLKKTYETTQKSLEKVEGVTGDSGYSLTRDLTEEIKILETIDKSAMSFRFARDQQGKPTMPLGREINVDFIVNVSKEVVNACGPVSMRLYQQLNQFDQEAAAGKRERPEGAPSFQTD